MKTMLPKSLLTISKPSRSSTIFVKARRFVDRLRAILESYDSETTGSVRTSFGVAAFRLADSRTTLLKRADVALYRAKLAGKNRVEVGPLEV